MKKFITVAPVGHYGLTEVINPKSPEEVAAAVIECAREGASLAHLHIRDAEGNLTRDMSDFCETVRLIRLKSDIIIQGSSGGVPKGGVGKLTREERCAAIRNSDVEVGSINMGSVNFGSDPFINSGDDIRFWADEMLKYSVKPELEIFEGGMLKSVRELINEGRLKPPYFCAFCLGYSLPDDPNNLFFLKSMLPENSLWGLNHQNMTDFSLSAVALGMGASYMRVGFEDGIFYAPGKIAGSNTELTAQAASLIRAMGFEVASPNEAREILGVKK